MRLLQLKLSHFRNLESWRTQIPPESGIVALIGPNGSGKTSVLEAISLLTPTRGLLSDDAKSQTAHGHKEWGIWTEVDLSSNIRTSEHPNTRISEIGQIYRKGERILQVDGQREPLEKLATMGSVTWLTPASDFLFTGAPEARRRWLDEVTTALFPAHAGAVARYRQHRQARLKLLTRQYNGERIAPDWLDAEERLAAEWGIRVLTARQEYLQRLLPLAEGLELYLHGGALEVMEAADPIAALKGKFERSREVDARMERTHAGPNTLDVQGTLKVDERYSVNLRNASSGQHKRGLLTWLAAHVRLVHQATGQPPVVLIDEFSAHLDALRRTNLLAMLKELNCQTWLTDVEAPAEELGCHLIFLGATNDESRVTINE